MGSGDQGIARALFLIHPVFFPDLHLDAVGRKSLRAPSDPTFCMRSGNIEPGLPPKSRAQAGGDSNSLWTAVGEVLEACCCARRRPLVVTLKKKKSFLK